MCQSVIVANLERYPAEMFGLLSEIDFEQLVQRRYTLTQPKYSKGGGLDGTGRVAPAIRDKVLQEIELCNPHLATSNLTDTLVWKDCVEHSFRKGGVSRPRALLQPWPHLVDQIKQAANIIYKLVSQESTKDNDDRLITVNMYQEALAVLMDTPMSVALLQATMVGKTLNKVLKVQQPQVPHIDQVQHLMTTWKQLATYETKTTTAKEELSTDLKRYLEETEDMKRAETCHSWRQLFAVLKSRQDARRSDQGKRMRERRQHLAIDRPKVVKVRPTTAKQARILQRPAERRKIAPATSSAWGTQAGTNNNTKMSKLKLESTIVAQRQRGAPTPPKKSAFGAAVAFAAVPKRSGGTKKTNHNVKLAGGKQMTVPNKITKGAGPRQLASKWKAGRR